MAELPIAFMETTRRLMGEQRFEQYLHSFEDEAPVSIRLNPKKTATGNGQLAVSHQPVPWCRHGFYLESRPNFTFDPLFHAGCYYVQEASSMFLDEVLRQQPIANSRQLTVLDLCAAPGGKSTLLRSALPEDAVLYSNEPIHNRANILSENVQKWGYDRHIVTNNYPRDYRKAKMKFDLILCDVPCSGEGMFRKDEATIREWSPQNVEKCWQLQREIVSDAWECLNAGGLFIYSTCTFNTKENEENIRWILDTYDAEVVQIDVRPEWNITGSLLPDFHEPVYRFIPGITRGEGLFMCVLRKKGADFSSALEKKLEYSGKKSRVQSKNFCIVNAENAPTDYPQVALSYTQAMAYLRREALVLPPDAPHGMVNVTFMGQVLGPAKNIGTRANNLYPKEWKIKTTHIPTEYAPVLSLKD